MSQVVAVTNKKGGVGKTTTCVNLAGALLEMGYRVSVGDMNKEQQSAFKWANRGNTLKSMVSVISDKKPRTDLERLKENSDIVLPGYAVD